ncbi:MAG TPA: Na+/H+ antiporter [Acidobacteriaceae bacterium]
MHSGVKDLQTVLLLLLLFVVIFGYLARKMKVAYPIVLVVAGLFLTFIPGLPKITLDPEVIFLVVLPPLLFHAAWETSWREFRANIFTIFLLAFGLVGFTVFGVAMASELWFSLLYWQTGLVLGAVIAPTDAIAAASIAKRVGLPQRITDILEGESLVNDATGLLALEFAVALIVSGEKPTLAAGALRLSYLLVAGIGIGVAVGWIVHWVQHHIDHGPIELTLDLISAYAAYIAAEQLHASGVLSVVACGFYLSRKSSSFFSPSVRLQAYALWDTVDFVLNGLVFVLIGLQLPLVLAGLHGYKTTTLVFYAASVNALVIVLRLLWVYPSSYLACIIRTRVRKTPERMPPVKEIFVTGWTGMRGVVALAAVLSLPLTLANGDPFPRRNLLIFLTFSVILVTLVLQGLTLPPLIRALGLDSATGPDCEEDEARRLMLQAALTYIETTRNPDHPEVTKVFDDIAGHLQARLAGLQTQPAEGATPHNHYLQISTDLLRIERETALQLRNDGHISDTVLRKLERELDLSETRMSAI